VTHLRKSDAGRTLSQNTACVYLHAVEELSLYYVPAPSNDGRLGVYSELL
jgi:hypothetical protein